MFNSILKIVEKFIFQLKILKNGIIFKRIDLYKKIFLIK
jgi:hypothetical protein